MPVPPLQPSAVVMMPTRFYHVTAALISILFYNHGVNRRVSQSGHL